MSAQLPLRDDERVEPSQSGPALLQVCESSLASVRDTLKQESNHPEAVLHNMAQEARCQPGIARLDDVVGTGFVPNAHLVAGQPVQYADHLLCIRHVLGGVRDYERGDVAHALKIGGLGDVALLPGRIDHGGPAWGSQCVLAVLLVDGRAAPGGLSAA